MFEILRTVQREIATEAVYLAGLRMREREFIDDWRRWLPLRPGNPTFPASLDVAATLIEEIEQRTAKRLEQLSEAELEPYRRCIHQVMDRRYARQRSGDPTVGRRILEELRRDYGRPDWQAVA
jgi:hypothetical protein